ncbi:hypothetical protein CI102_2400 [Trichoderma harzianum]|uniref:Uncharacterized protein n=1 Tax=Trichoderma harzianum CBS 226.95 TaxID=983964 RepID=A0A2T4AM76_TRIHA|nr:hypothetical protein M431DRAFT_359836 [Trichoderma harzianum CBS 226.95]PKK52682.1 hypothetical protein CI102_2400 [Trichoderma harzianum]PTB58176.1 hypothetical protein M431DRAFT_359836 [Trichoderma harzianum CBS 226.95]
MAHAVGPVVSAHSLGTMLLMLPLPLLPLLMMILLLLLFKSSSCSKRTERRSRLPHSSTLRSFGVQHWLPTLGTPVLFWITCQLSSLSAGSARASFCCSRFKTDRLASVWLHLFLVASDVVQWLRPRPAPLRTSLYIMCPRLSGSWDPAAWDALFHAPLALIEAEAGYKSV